MTLSWTTPIASTPPTPTLSPAAFQCTSTVSVLPLPWVHLPLPHLFRYLSYAAWPSHPFPIWGNPRAHPPASWTLPPTKPRSLPQIVTTPAPLTNRTLLTMAGPPPLSVEFYPDWYRLGMPSWNSGRMPASFWPTGLTSIPDTWKYSQPQCIPPRLPPRGWRMPPRIGFRYDFSV